MCNQPSLGSSSVLDCKATAYRMAPIFFESTKLFLFKAFCYKMLSTTGGKNGLVVTPGTSDLKLGLENLLSFGGNARMNEVACPGGAILLVVNTKVNLHFIQKG